MVAEAKFKEEPTAAAAAKKRSDNNGWSVELEEEMAGILRVLKTKDQEQYMTCGELVTNINRTLAVSGPILAAVAAIGTGLIGSSTVHEPWPALIGVVGGALATVVNTLEHGGQMGMVFELFRNCAGYYVRLEEEIENNLGERRAEEGRWRAVSNEDGSAPREEPV
ncbi:putative F-box protein [Iris pallida]|uniref:F-box protein n=1 Tax=Iris pallida TaxID=29817 RepID=A0AAX6EYI9_IRIPA|nr:putative F-box protein [Iris pallida]